MSSDTVRHLVVLSHPRDDSFCHQIAAAYCEEVEACGQSPVLRDLYKLRFDPILEAPEVPELSVIYDLTEIRRCDVLVFIYPIWFGLPPAMIKGYVDRVLGGGFVPSSEHPRANDRFLRGRRMVSFSTSASTDAWFTEHGQMGALRDAFDGYLQDIFGLAGTDHVHIGAVVENMGAAYAEAELLRVREMARSVCARVDRAVHGVPTEPLPQPDDMFADARTTAGRTTS
jgi:NAD(P)H dehydrogenase (quinone)